jgi:hypothetical protein
MNTRLSIYCFRAIPIKGSTAHFYSPNIMVQSYICWSTSVKYRLVGHVEAGMSINEAIAALPEATDMPEVTAYCILKNFKETRSVENRRRTCIPCQLTQHELH